MVIVVPAEPRHVDALATLLEELDRYYGATELEPREQRMEHIQEALFGDAPAATVLLAWDGDQLVGMASYSFLWPAAGMTRSLFLKELYIAQPYRRQGIGKCLMRTIFEVARRHACSRVEWTTDRESTGSQRFYAELGMPVATNKLFYRMTLGERVSS